MQPILSKFQKVHGDKYDYSKVIYTTAKTKVIIICKTHGEFTITPNNHLNGSGCPKCYGRGFTAQEKLERFIKEGALIHNGKYDYSKVVITDKKLKIICPVHGEFLQLHRAHTINKSGCPKCGIKIASSKNKLSITEFIKKANATHNNKYTYDNVDYQGAHKKVLVTCLTHGDFAVTPANHWSNGIGCPHCFRSNPSKGEVKIAEWLTLHNISFVPQKTFPDLYYKSKNGRLKYDFFIPHLKILIEFDGEYHYSPITFSRSITKEEQFKLTKIRDSLKTNYARDNGLYLLRVRFDDNIDKVLSEHILRKPF